MAVLLAAAMIVGQALTDGIDTAPYAPPEPVDQVVELEPEPEPAPPPIRAVWYRLAECESSSRWHINSGNSYYGGLQMDMVFWRRHGGLAFAARPDLATVADQVAVAEVGLKVQGFGAWPACSRRLGLR